MNDSNKGRTEVAARSPVRRWEYRSSGLQWVQISVTWIRSGEIPASVHDDPRWPAINPNVLPIRLFSRIRSWTASEVQRRRKLLRHLRRRPRNSPCRCWGRCRRLISSGRVPKASAMVSTVTRPSVHGAAPAGVAEARWHDAPDPQNIRGRSRRRMSPA